MYICHKNNNRPNTERLNQCESWRSDQNELFPLSFQVWTGNLTPPSFPDYQIRIYCSISFYNIFSVASKNLNMPRFTVWVWAPPSTSPVCIDLPASWGVEAGGTPRRPPSAPRRASGSRWRNGETTALWQDYCPHLSCLSRTNFQFLKIGPNRYSMKIASFRLEKTILPSTDSTITWEYSSSSRCGSDSQGSS